jgi:hypothetical protein
MADDLAYLDGPGDRQRVGRWPAGCSGRALSIAVTWWPRWSMRSRWRRAGASVTGRGRSPPRHSRALVASRDLSAALASRAVRQLDRRGQVGRPMLTHAESPAARSVLAATTARATPKRSVALAGCQQVVPGDASTRCASIAGRAAVAPEVAPEPASATR